MRLAKWISGVSLGIAVMLVAATPAASQSAAEFYKGKTVKFVVGYGPGGGFDTYARAIGPYIEKELGVTVVVENRPGGGQMIALNRVYEDKPDGLTIMILNTPPMILQQLLDQKGVRFDLTKITFLNRIVAEPFMLFVNPDSPHKTIQDVMKAPLIKFASGSRTDGMGDYALTICEALQLKCKLITGYAGSQEVSLAVVRGEAEAMAIADGSGSRLTRDGKVRPIATFARGRSEYLPDVKTIYEIMKLEGDAKWWIDFRNKIQEVGRSIVTSPGVPKDRVAALRGAVERIFKNKEFLAMMEKGKRPIGYLPGPSVAELVEETLERISPEQKKRAQELYLTKF